MLMVRCFEAKANRAGTSGEGARRGAGLGLTLVKALMEMHGGTAELSSTPGKGTTVTVQFSPERMVE